MYHKFLFSSMIKYFLPIRYCPKQEAQPAAKTANVFGAPNRLSRKNLLHLAVKGGLIHEHFP
jgi:hypothetical protein